MQNTSAIFVFADLTPDGFHLWMTLSPRTSEPVRHGPCPLEQNSGDASAKMQCTAKLNIAKLTLQGWVNTDTLLDHYKRINFPADKDIFLEFSIWSDPPKFTKVSTRSDPTRLDPWVDQTRGHLCVINASIVNSKLLENVFCSDLDLWTRDLQTKRKRKCMCKTWLKSLHSSWTTAFKDLFSHRCTADLQLRTNCLLNVISFICTCWRLIVTSFIKVSPQIQAP